MDADEPLERDGETAGSQPAGSRVPGWVFVVVPMLVVGLIVGAVAVAARSAGDDDEDGVERLGGPAAELPAVVDAIEVLGATPVDAGDRAVQVGQRVGVLTLGLVELADDSDFAANFDVLPPAGARRLGQVLGAIQREVSPSSVGGPRSDDDARDDLVFALELVWAASPTIDPTAPPEQQALNVLPAAVPLADEGDEIVAAVTAGDMEQAADLLEPVLGDAAAAEVVSGLAGDISDRLGEVNDVRRLAEFQDAYRLELP